MKLIKKITHGFVTQVWNADTQQFMGQDFTAGDDVEFVDEDDKPIPPHTTLYEPFDMAQPPGY